MANLFSLATVREAVIGQCTRLLDSAGPYGCYRRGEGQRPDLYSSLDVALLRAIMGEDLQQTLTLSQREQWIGHINSYAKNSFGQSTDGSYEDTFGHSTLHANGMVIGALGVLGGKKRDPCRLYDPFSALDDVADWLDKKIDWTNPWSESHKFWGGLHCYSLSSAVSPKWLAAVFCWLNENADPATGWWRKGIVAREPFAYLGGAVHIFPIYEHHNQTFPYAESMLDSVIKMQTTTGCWHPEAHPFNYLNLDGLYTLVLARRWVPANRTSDILLAAQRFADTAVAYYRQKQQVLLADHPHYLLALVSTFGLLQQLLPEQFVDDTIWGDIFGDIRFYQTAAVETGKPE